MNEHTKDTALTEHTYRQGIRELVGRDPGLAMVISRYGNPPFWTHTPGFLGIVLAILSQQVSLESAQATFNRLLHITGSISPDHFLSLNAQTLKGIGFSRQKSSYIRGVALDMLAGEFNLEEVELMDDERARERLTEVRGIGPWTADTYLLFALRRRDAWPSRDLALAKAIQEIRGQITIPSWEEVDSIADHWRPWRAVAARILWHHYLNERGRDSSA
jgi:DNA-3-methyladenine glycosylase II